MPRILNWASLTFLVTIAGLVVPIWLWRADLNAKSLAFQLTSQVPLTADSVGEIKGLEVLMDGVKVQSPTLSVVTLINDGKKPLPTADFEAPVDIRIGEGSTVVRAEVTATHPKDIEAKITWDKSVVRFNPVLLNPEETITVSILSEGSKPVFSTRARVVGISTVEFVDNTKKSSTWQLAAVFLIAAVLLFAASDIADISFVGSSKTIVIRKRAALLLKLTCGFAGMGAFFFFANIVDLGTSTAMYASLVGVIIAGTILGTALNFRAQAVAEAEVVSQHLGESNP